MMLLLVLTVEPCMLEIVIESYLAYTVKATDCFVFYALYRTDLVILAEEAVSNIPLNILETSQEKYILDYFAEIGLFIYLNQYVWAETTLRRLILLRSSSPDIGPDHEETLYLQRYLEKVVRDSGRTDEANEIFNKIKHYGQFLLRFYSSATSYFFHHLTTTLRIMAQKILKRKKMAKAHRCGRQLLIHSRLPAQMMIESDKR